MSALATHPSLLLASLKRVHREAGLASADRYCINLQARPPQSTHGGREWAGNGNNQN